MQPITRYQADDGVIFTTSAECIQYEANTQLASLIMSKLPTPTVNSCDFSNGAGYIQHNIETVISVRNQFLRFIQQEYSTHRWIQDTIDGADIHASYAGRIICECCPSAISKHWYRFQCMDKQYREWGQPYFADNPDKAEQVRLN